MDILIGGDPELFVSKRGEPVSAFGMIPGTKDNPHIIDEGAVQVDGMALEVNLPPAQTEQQFQKGLDDVLAALHAMIPKNHEFLITPSVTFSQEVMDSTPEEAKVLGCDPDFNADTGNMNAAPVASDNIRAAGGHIHVGWTHNHDVLDPTHLDACRTLVKLMDIFLWVPSNVIDMDQLRRHSYGRRGAFRPKPYGVEYRTLSNFWIKHPDLTSWAWKQTHLAIKYAMIPDHPLKDLYVPYSFITDGIVGRVMRYTQQHVNGLLDREDWYKRSDLLKLRELAK